MNVESFITMQNETPFGGIRKLDNESVMPMFSVKWL